MDQALLNRRCVKLFRHPRVRLQMWHAPVFWETDLIDNPRPEDLARPKVDLRELEFLLSAAAMVPSECAPELDERVRGRADFIRRHVRSGQRPLLNRPVGD